MLGLWCPEPGVTRMRDDWPEPEITGEGQLLVQLEYASVCGSDIHHIFDGLFHPRAPETAGFSGHEGVGTVLASTSGLFRPGDRILVLPDGQLGGCFAERIRITEGQAIGLPDGLEFRPGLMSQQYGTTIFAMKSFWPTEVPARRADAAVVLGCGSAGLFFAQDLLARHGFGRVIASDPDPHRRAVAAELGAHAVGPDEVAAVVAETTGGAGADLVIEAVGTSELRNAAVALAKPFGVVGVFGVPTVDTEEWGVQLAFRNRLRIQYCVNTQAEPGLLSFRESIRRLAAGETRADYCLGRVYPLIEVPTALQAASECGRGDVKVTVRCRLG